MGRRKSCPLTPGAVSRQVTCFHPWKPVDQALETQRSAAAIMIQARAASIANDGVAKVAIGYAGSGGRAQRVMSATNFQTGSLHSELHATGVSGKRQGSSSSKRIRDRPVLLTYLQHFYDVSLSRTAPGFLGPPHRTKADTDAYRDGLAASAVRTPSSWCCATGELALGSAICEKR